MNIPSPFSRRRKTDPEPEPEIVLDVDIPFGTHPLIDYVRFTLMLLQNQAELAENQTALTDLVVEQSRRYQQMRRGLLAVCIASLIATLFQAVQIWSDWR